MSLLLYQSFFGHFQIDSFKDKSDEVYKVNYYKNEEILFSSTYEGKKLIEIKNFEENVKNKILYNYYENYYIYNKYSFSGDMIKMRICFDRTFEKYGISGYNIKSKDDFKVNRLENGIQEIRSSIQDLNIVFLFKDNMLINLVYDVADSEKSYVINADYDNLGRLINVKKENLKYSDYHNKKQKLYEYEDDFVLEKELQDDEISFKLTQYDNKKRPIKRISFINNEEELYLVKAYMKNSNEETLKLVMKFINLEIFEYDHFDNQTAYEKMYYRPDFSKDSLTYYIQEYNYYDKYNINYGYFYCKTKTDYDDDIDSESRLEYLDNRVNQYTGEVLTAIHHLENEKKIKSEFFIKDSYEFDKYDETGKAEYVYKDLYVIENYDEFGNAIESFVKNEKTGEVDHYKIEVIYQ